MKRFLFCTLLVFRIALLFADNNAGPLDGFVFESLDVHSQTLSNDSARCIVIDNDGYVWIGTRIGLNRYDGTRTRVFLKDETGLDSDFIYSLYVAQDGSIWVGTMDGIARYDKLTDSFSVPADQSGKPIHGCINSITGDKDGVIWFDNYGPDLFSFNASDGFIRKHSLGLTDSRKRLAFDIDGRLIVCSSCDDIYIYVMEAGSLRRIQVNDFAGSFKGDELLGPIASLTNRDLFYIADKRIGICEVNIANGNVRVLYSFPADQKPTSLVSYGAGRLMATTSDGLVLCDIWDEGNATVMRRDYAGAKFEYLLCATRGNDGSLWIGTRNNGVLYNRPAQNRFIKTVRLENGQALSSIEMNDCCEDSDGTVWIATNNAGIIKRIPMHEMKREEFQQVIDVDLVAPYIVSAAVLPEMMERREGKIINICSMMSELGRETVSAYAAAKGGLKMLTRNICSEYGEYNIQCNGIGPGYIATPQTAPLREKQPDGSRHPFDSFICAKTPAGRWLQPEELGGPAVFLASHASDAVNGHILYVDGGILAYIGKQPTP